MKFTKEEAFESLKGILTNGGKKPLRMSEKSINKQLESLMPLIANDEMELDDFVGKVKDTFSVMNSNAEKDNSDFIKKWEKEHPEPTNPEPPKADDPKDDDPVAKMMKRLEELENREKAREKEQTMAQKKKDLLKAMKEKGIKDEQWSKDLVAEISMTEDFDIEAKADAYLKLYNKSQSSFSEGYTPRSTSNSGERREENPFAETAKLMKAEKEQFKNLK